MLAFSAFWLVCSLPRNELVEPALLAARGFVLIKEGQAVRIEGFEPLVPLDALERTFAAEAGKIDAKDSGVLFVAGALDVRREPAALLYPVLDLVMIDRGFRRTHTVLLLCQVTQGECHARSEERLRMRSAHRAHKPCM